MSTTRQRTQLVCFQYRASRGGRNVTPVPTTDFDSDTLTRGDFQSATQFVDDESGQRFAFDLFGDDKKRAPRLHHGFRIAPLAFPAVAASTNISAPSRSIRARPERSSSEPF
jgi:hypothetical protein